MEFGKIVYFNKLVFKDGIIDEKENRPCVVMGVYEEKNKQYVLCLPITSSIYSFNRYPSKYVLIPQTIYNYRKICFAKMDNLFANDVNLVKSSGYILDKVSFDLLVNKLMTFPDETKLYRIAREILIENGYYEERLVDKEQKVKKL